MSMHVLFDTDCGKFTAQLALEAAPLTAGYFRDLIAMEALNATSFYRIVAADNAEICAEHPINVVQGGLRDTDSQPLPPTPHEPTSKTGLSHKQWTLSAARFDPGQTYGSFFICMRNEPALDFGGGRHPDGLGFAAFGEIATGFDVVETIFGRRTKSEFLDRPISIHQCTMLP